MKLMGEAVKVRQLSGGADKKKRTLLLMIKLIKSGARDLRIRALTNKIIRDIPEGDYTAEVEAIAAWIKNHVRYSRDPFMVESVADAWDTIRLGAGDCDDLTVLAGAMCESVGAQVRIKIVGGAVFSHVFLEVNTHDDYWQTLDLARPRDKVFHEREYNKSAVINLNTLKKKARCSHGKFERTI